MNYYDQSLKAYADSGLRTAADWAVRGRAVRPDSTPRADTQHRGASVSLYTRDQTDIVRREK